MSEVVKLPGNEIERAAANVIEHAGKNIADGATNFGSVVFNGLIGDKVREWRTRNLFRGAAKTAEILREIGVPLENARSLPMFEFYSIFEGMSGQDDPDVADLWSGLLASRMSTDQGKDFDRSVPQTLASLNGTEARVLKFLNEYSRLEARLAKHRAPLYLGIPVGKEREAEEARVANERLMGERVKEISALRDEILRGNADEFYNAAAITLNNKRLVYLEKHHRWHESYTRRTYFDGSGSVEMLDERKITDALRRLNRDALGISQENTAEAVALLSEFQGISVNYGLTDAAAYLLRCCEPQL